MFNFKYPRHPSVPNSNHYGPFARPYGWGSEVLSRSPDTLKGSKPRTVSAHVVCSCVGVRICRSCRHPGMWVCRYCVCRMLVLHHIRERIPVPLCMYTRIHMHSRVYIYIYTCVYAYTHTHVIIHMHVHIHMNLHIYIYTRILCVCVWMHTYKYMYIYMHTWIHMNKR